MGNETFNENIKEANDVAKEEIIIEDKTDEIGIDLMISDDKIQDERTALAKEKQTKHLQFDKKKVLKWIITSSFIVLSVAFLIFALIGKAVFREGTTVYELSTQNVGKFFNFISFFQVNGTRLLDSLVIIVFLWLVSKVFQLIINFVTIKGRRSATIGRLFTSVVKYSIVIIGIFMILSAWGVQTPALLASAGIIGLAISLGAQSLISDILSGLFIIFEKQFEVGDIIQIDNFRGRVIEIGIRATKFEDLSGDIKIINNSDIRSAINTTENLSPAICDVSVTYGADLEKIEEVIKNNLEYIKNEIPKIKEGLTILALRHWVSHL